MLRRSLKILAIVLTIFGILSPASAIELKTAAQESAPKYFKDNNNPMGGICVDIIQAIQRIEPEIQFTGYQNFLPFKRLQKYLEDGQLDIFFGMKETAERREKYRFVDIPLYQLNYVIATRMDDNVTINSLEDVRSLGKDGKILTVNGAAASKFLRNEGGLLVDDSAVSPSGLLNMLNLGRGRFAFYHDLGLQKAVKKMALEGKVKIHSQSFLAYSHYVAFSKQTHGETVEKVRNALEKLSVSGELGRIYSNYVNRR